VLEAVEGQRVVIFGLFTFGAVESGHVILAVGVFTASRALSGLFLALVSGSGRLVLFSTYVIVAGHKLGPDRLGGGGGTPHPGVGEDINHAKALAGMKLQHEGHQLLELIRKETGRPAVRVLLPEEVGPVSDDQLVGLVVRVSPVEWEITRVHNEQNYTESEQVHILTLVRVSYDNLGRHEGYGTDHGLQLTLAVAALQRRSDSEVRDLDIVIFVQKDILRLEVTVSQAFRVDIVNYLEHLLEVEAADLLREGAL